MSAAAATRQASPSGGWTHHIPASFFERLDLEPNLERLVLRLEGLARDKPWCVTSNDELMQLLGCSRNTLAAALKRGEQLGWFRRALITGPHGHATGRLGIVLFIRPTERAVASPETFDQVVQFMRAQLPRGRAAGRPSTLPFPAPIPQESARTAPQNLGTAAPKNWVPPAPKNWVPPSYSKEGITDQETETTTTAADEAPSPPDIHASPGSSSSVLDPEPERTEQPGVEVLGDAPAPQHSAIDAFTHSIVPPPAPIERPAPPAAPPAEAELPAELVKAAAEVMPGASRNWLGGLLRDCGAYGLDLALLVLAWAKVKRPHTPMGYARSALSGWLAKLEAGAMTLEDVRSEVQGRSGPRASPRAFDASACLARMASLGWKLEAMGPDLVKWTDIAGPSACLWRHVPRDLRAELEEHKGELKAYVLEGAAERGKTVAIRA